MKQIFAYAVLFICFACNTSNKNPYENSLGIEPAVIAEMDTAHYTTIQWKDSVINFGTIKKGDSIQLRYSFTNTGKTPLFIFQTQATCGCTITNFNKKPIMPGKSGFITVLFKSGVQTGEINKNITVVANTKTRKNNRLVIRGVVKPAANINSAE